MLLLYLQDADLNVKHPEMLVLAEIVLSGDGQEGCALSSAVWQQGHWPWGRWFKCPLCSNTAWPRDFPVLLWHSQCWRRAGCEIFIFPAGTRTDSGLSCSAILLFPPRWEISKAFPVTQSSWHTALRVNWERSVSLWSLFSSTLSCSFLEETPELLCSFMILVSKVLANGLFLWLHGQETTHNYIF